MSRCCFTLLLLSCLLAGCARHAARHAVKADFQPDPALAGKTVKPWTKEMPSQAAGAFQFAVIADLTGGGRPGIFEEAVERVNQLQPEFVMCVGDLIEGYSEDKNIIANQMDQFSKWLAKMEAPFFHVPGNHDVEMQTGRDGWMERHGSPYYHFLYKDVLFLVLDSIEGPNPNKSTEADHGGYGISAKQVDYVAKTLAQYPQARWTLVFLHVPLWETNSGAGDPGWGQVEQLLANRPYTVFAGHIHSYEKSEHNGRSYYRLATTGGGSSLAGPQVGEFDGMLWVTFKDDGPRVLPLDLKGMYPDDVCTSKSMQMFSAAELSCAPALPTGDVFTNGAASITVGNRADIPMQVALKPQENRLFKAEFDALERTIEPHTTQTITAQIASRVALPAEFLPSLQADMLARFEPAGEKPVELAKQTVSLVDSVLPCPKRGKPVVLDGKLDEWGEMPYAVENKDQIEGPAKWDGAADASYRFALAYDDNYVYIAARIQDDKFFVGTATGMAGLAYDHISLAFDLHPESAMSPDYRKPADGRVNIWCRATDKAEEGPTFPIDVEGFKAVCVKDAGGYNLEMALPTAYFDQQSGGKPWEKFQFSMIFHDTDDDTQDYLDLAWRPESSRIGANYLPNSTFVRKQ